MKGVTLVVPVVTGTIAFWLGKKVNDCPEQALRRGLSPREAAAAGGPLC